MLRKAFRVSYSDISYAVQEKKQNKINRRSDCPFLLITNGARKDMRPSGKMMTGNAK